MKNRMFANLMRELHLPMEPEPTGINYSGKLLVKPKIILFDIYGTLFISSSGDISDFKGGFKGQVYIKNKIIEMLLDKNLDQNVDKLIRKMKKSINDEHLKSRTKGTAFPEIDIRSIWKKILNIYDDIWVEKLSILFELYMNPVYPMPGLENILKSLRQGKIILGIISNAQFYTPILFQSFLGKDFLSIGFQEDLIFFSYRYKIAKPSTHLFKVAKNKIIQKGFSPSEVLFVGNDMLKDIYPSQKTGFQTCLFAGDKRSLRLRREDARCLDLKPDLIINNLTQLKKVL